MFYAKSKNIKIIKPSHREGFMVGVERLSCCARIKRLRSLLQQKLFVSVSELNSTKHFVFCLPLLACVRTPTKLCFVEFSHLSSHNKRDNNKSHCLFYGGGKEQKLELFAEHLYDELQKVETIILIEEVKLFLQFQQIC